MSTRILSINNKYESKSGNINTKHKLFHINILPHESEILIRLLKCLYETSFSKITYYMFRENISMK